MLPFYSHTGTNGSILGTYFHLCVVGCNIPCYFSIPAIYYVNFSFVYIHIYLSIYIYHYLISYIIPILFTTIYLYLSVYIYTYHGRVSYGKLTHSMAGDGSLSFSFAVTGPGTSRSTWPSSSVAVRTSPDMLRGTAWFLNLGFTRHHEKLY